jgi:hypothetical protein
VNTGFAVKFKLRSGVELGDENAVAAEDGIGAFNDSMVDGNGFIEVVSHAEVEDSVIFEADADREKYDFLRDISGFGGSKTGGRGDLDSSIKLRGRRGESCERITGEKEFRGD